MASSSKYKYAALCIGINEYDKNTPLTCAVNDAEAIANAFTDLQYDVIKLTGNNTTYNHYTDAYTQLLSQNLSKQYDAIILYFAGHGFVTNGSDCLALKDAEELRLSDGLPAKARSIDVQDFINAFRKRTTPVLILILDACRHDLSDYADVLDRGPRVIMSDTIGKCVNVPTQTFIAYSTSYNKGAKDGVDPKGHSKYTAALLDEIKKELPIETIFKNVRSKVHQSNDDQLPWEYTCLTDEFFFNYGQLEPYYNAEYSKEAFMYFKYNTDNKDAQCIIDWLKSGDKAAIEDALISLLSKKGSLSNDDLFVIGRYIYLNASRNIVECREYLTSKTIKLFGAEINHLLRGIYYEIYFDENNNLRTNALGNADILTIVDNLQMLLKNDDAAKFVKKYVTTQQNDIRFLIWDTSSEITVDIDAEEMYCTDEERDNVIYGIRNVVVDGEEILTKLQMEMQSVVTKEQLRQQISESISIPLRRLKFKGLENDNNAEHSYMMFYIDNIEQILFDAINYSLPDEIIGMSSNSYVDELYGVILSDLSYDGNELTLEGTCSLDIHNEMDHEEMPGCTLPCYFTAVLSYDKNSSTYEWNDGEFNVDMDEYYK